MTFLKRLRNWLLKRPLDASQVPLIDIPLTTGLYNVEKSLSGSFLFPENNLYEIRLFIRDKEKDSRLTLVISDDMGHRLREILLDDRSIKVNGFSSFKFKPIPDSRGRTLRFKLIIDGGKVGVSYDDHYVSERLALSSDGRTMKGAIGFQAFAMADIKTLYEIWMLKNEPVATELAFYKKASEGFAYRPKISIITPVFNPEVAWIRAAVESVLAQAYDNWELCLAGASTRDDVKNCLREYAGKDQRVKVKFLEKNGGISLNSNEALSMATGGFVALLDHDDTLSPDALYEAVKLLQRHPDADMIYSDEDKIDVNGNRTLPFFKPDWSPDLLLSCMYTGHLSVYRKSIVDSIGGFGEGYDGSQDYDLALRIIDKTSNIRHVPKILYHWRMVPGSAADSVDSKAYAYDAAKRALGDYMVRNNIKGEVGDGLWRGSYHVKRDLLKMPKVSIIIPTKDHANDLKKFIDSIKENTRYPDHEIIVVNNNSKEKETFDYFDELGRSENVQVLDYNMEFNISAINNYAVRRSSGEVLLFLNNGTKVATDMWMTALLEQAQRSEVGAVGCKLIYPDNRVQHAGIILGINGRGDDNNVAENSPYLGNSQHHGYAGRESVTLDLSAVTAACMMIRREVFEEIGGFDENLAVAYNDVDLCLRLRQKGYLIVYTPYAVLYHNESCTRGYEDTKDKRERFEREIQYMRSKWASVIDAGDPYYNPNLSLRHGDFRLKV